MPQETKRATVTWRGGMRFDSPAPGGSTILMDGDGRDGVSPVVALLLSAAACSGTDIVLILEKMRATIREFSIDTAGVRREDHPRRYVSIHFTFRLRGEGFDETQARRAVDLSLEKYCSVVQSLAPDIPVTYDLDLG